MRLLLPLALVLAAGCLGSHRELCEAQVRAGCELRYRCCSSAEELFDLLGFGVDVYATSEGECIDRVLPACRGRSAALDEAVALDRVDFDEDLAAECVAALEAARDTCDLAGANAALADGPCARVSVGLVADGEACAADVECTDGVCAFEDPSDPAVDDALSAPVGVCVGPARVGESCVDRVCDEGLACISGTCREAPGDGEACPDFICDVDLICVGGACEPLPGDGDTCDFQCVVGFFCDASVEPRTCEAQKAPGEPCSGLSFAECADGLQCSSGRCPGGDVVEICTGRP